MRKIKTKNKTENKPIAFLSWLDEKMLDNDNIIKNEKLDCSNCNLTDLNGIDKFENLRFLYCQNNLIDSFKPISKLKKLEYVNCSDNNIENFIGINKLKKLEHLITKNIKLPDGYNTHILNYCETNFI